MPALLRNNRKFRYAWISQFLSECADNFNLIAVFSLALKFTGSGMVVGNLMLARAIPMILAGPLAGIALDRWPRKRVLMSSNLARAVVALGFIAAIAEERTWLLYPLSSALMFAAPFFTSGRTAILPSITDEDELHTANSLTQLTSFGAVTIGMLVGGFAVSTLGFTTAFVLNALLLAASAWLIARIRIPKEDQPPVPKTLNETDVARPWRDYREGLRYLAATPLMLGIALVHVGWATGGGMAQVLFALFANQVFGKGPAGIGLLWSAAGMGLLAGGVLTHLFGRQISFSKYKKTIIFCHLLHGVSYMLFSQTEHFWAALLFVGFSRVGLAASQILNQTQLLIHVSDAYRGRVFSTIETMTWAMVMISVTIAGVASESIDPRIIGLCAGFVSSLTAVGWWLANRMGRLPEPELRGIEPAEVEVRGVPRA